MARGGASGLDIERLKAARAVVPAVPAVSVRRLEVGDLLGSAGPARPGIGLPSSPVSAKGVPAPSISSPASDERTVRIERAKALAGELHEHLA